MSARVVDADTLGLDTAVECLQSGGVAAIPTDTVYGLAAAARAGVAGRIFGIKDRPADLALPVLCASLADADRIATIAGRARELVEHYWPGPLTIVVPRRRGFDVDLGGDPASVGLRVPDHPVPCALAARVGPLASTSANRHGAAPSRSAAGVVRTLGDRIDVVVRDPLPETGSGRASTVVRCDADGAVLEIIRRGDVAVNLLP